MRETKKSFFSPFNSLFSFPSLLSQNLTKMLDDVSSAWCTGVLKMLTLKPGRRRRLAEARALLITCKGAAVDFWEKYEAAEDGAVAVESDMGMGAAAPLA